MAERLRAGQAWRGDAWGLVFTTPNGEPLDDRLLRYRFKLLLEYAGLPRIRFHDLRHSCASLLVAQGVHPRIVIEILGHSDIGTTMNFYSHVISDTMRQAVGVLDRLFAAGADPRVFGYIPGYIRQRRRPPMRVGRLHFPCYS